MVYSVNSILKSYFFTSNPMKTRGKLLAVVVVLFFFMEIYALIELPKEHPPFTEIIANPSKYEDETIYLRGFYLGFDEYPILETLGFKYKAKNLEGRFGLGDVIDMEVVLHLKEGYVEVLDFHHRTASQHSSMFLISLPGLVIVLIFMWRDRRIFRGVWS